MRRQRQHEAGRNPTVTAFAGAHLVQRRERQPAGEEGIERRETEPEAPPPLVWPRPRRKNGWLSARRPGGGIQHQPIRLGEAAFDAGNVPAQAAKLRLCRGGDGHERSRQISCSLFVPRLREGGAESRESPPVAAQHQEWGRKPFAD